jgi:hypothetical protein
MAAIGMIGIKSRFSNLARCVAVFLLLATELSAQSKILVPYRDKSQWGFADTSGKLVVKPQFDAILFDHSHPEYYEAKIPKHHYLTKVDSLLGLIGPELIIPNQYRFIRQHQSEIFVAQTFSNFQMHFYSKKGVRILNDAQRIERLEFSYFRKKGKLDRSPIHLLKVVQSGRQLSLYAYYPNELQKSHFIIQDCASILKTNQFEVDRVAFKVQKNSQSNFEILTLAYDPKTDRFEESPVQMASSDNLGLSGSGSGTGNGGEPDDYPSRQSEQQNPNKTAQFTFDTATSILHLELLPMRSRTKTSDSNFRTPIALPQGASSVQVIAYTGPSNKQSYVDSVVFYRNFVQYKIDQKTCMIVFDQQPPICYDSVSVVYPDNNINHHFLIGVRQTNNSLKFGMVNDSNEVIIPPTYDQLSGLPENKYQNINYRDYIFVVAQNNLKGLLTLDNRQVLPCRYSEILTTKKTKDDVQLFELQSKNLQGAYYQYKPRNSKPPVSAALLEPFTEHRIKAMRFLDVDENASEYRKVFPLLQITSNDGKLVGYYHPKGLKFWKD